MEIHLQHLLRVHESPISNGNKRNRFNVLQEQKVHSFFFFSCRASWSCACLGGVGWREDSGEGGKERRKRGRGMDSKGRKEKSGRFLFFFGCAFLSAPAKSHLGQDVNTAICQSEGFFTLSAPLRGPGDSGGPSSPAATLWSFEWNHLLFSEQVCFAIQVDFTSGFRSGSGWLLQLARTRLTGLQNQIKCMVLFSTSEMKP